MARRSGFWTPFLVAWLGLAVSLAVRGTRATVHGEAAPAPAREGEAVAFRHDPARGENLDILLVTLDTVRPDHLGCYGSPVARTPTLDSLASGGVRFVHACAAVPLTLPSHTTMLAGRSAARHTVHTNGTRVVAPEESLLAEILHDGGFRTAAFVSALVLQRRFGLDQGFDLYDDSVHRIHTEIPVFVSERPANETTDAALAWLDGLDGRRNFFAWVHYYDAHAEYVPPPPYDRLFADSPYDGEIAFMDAELGRLIQGLRAQGRWENTLLVVASDHGEGLKDHGETSHGILLYDSTVRVALLVSHPSARASGEGGRRWRGRVVEDPVRLVDIAPTILELAGAPAPETMEGASLVPLVTGEGAAPTGSVYADAFPSWEDYGWARLFTLRDRQWKYLHGAREELYDLENDPRELHDLAAAEPERVARFRRELEGYLERAAAEATQPSATAIDAATLQRLQSLGYVGSGAAPPDTGVVRLEDDESRRDPTVMIRYHEESMLPAMWALHLGRYDEATRYFRAFLEADPGNRQGLNGLAACEIARGDLAEARRLLERVVRENPQWQRPFKTLAEVLQRQGEIEPGIDCLRRAIALIPTDPEAHYGLGTFLKEKGDLEGAIAELQTAVDYDPGLLQAQYNLGLVLVRRGTPDLALRHFRAALESGPDHVPSMLELAELYITLGPASRAIPLLERALPLASPGEQASILANLGNARARLEDHEAAAAAFARALALDPGDAHTHYMLGCSIYALGRVAEAREAWTRALALDSQLQAARENLSRTAGGT